MIDLCEVKIKEVIGLRCKTRMIKDSKKRLLNLFLILICRLCRSGTDSVLSRLRN